MARQATLFGKAAVKEPFFKISSECSSYYRTINALWQLHPGNDRHEFFRASQDKWSAKYKGNDDAVAALLGRVELQGRSSTDGRRLMPSFLGATGRSSKEPVADAAGSAPISSTTGTASTDNTDVEVVLSVSSARKPLVLLCEALDVNPSSFLTEDVVGKASVVATLTTVAERFALYRSEKRHYTSLLVSSKRHPGHYLTFRECCVQQELGQQLAAPDADLPSGTHGRCEFGCHYVYLSARDKDRHERLVHHAEFKARQVQRRQEKRRANAEETGTDRPAKKSVHRCTFPGCGLAFLSAYQLTLHKKMQGTFCHEADRRKAPDLVATLVHANALCSVPVHTSVHLSIGVETEVFVCVCLCVCVCVCVCVFRRDSVVTISSTSVVVFVSAFISRRWGWKNQYFLFTDWGWVGGSPEILMFYGPRIIPYIYGRPLRYIVLSEGSRLPRTETENPIVRRLWSSYEVRSFASRQRLGSLPSLNICCIHF